MEDLSVFGEVMYFKVKLPKNYHLNYCICCTKERKREPFPMVLHKFVYLGNKCFLH